MVVRLLLCLFLISLSLPLLNYAAHTYLGKYLAEFRAESESEKHENDHVNE